MPDVAGSMGEQLAHWPEVPVSMPSRRESGRLAKPAFAAFVPVLWASRGVKGDDASVAEQWYHGRPEDQCNWGMRVLEPLSDAKSLNWTSRRPSRKEIW